MRKHLRSFTDICQRQLPLPEPVFEYGALQVHGDPELEDLRSIFNGRTYVGCDMRPGPGVDRVLNLHCLDLPDASVGTAICMDTLEHVEYPRQAIRELYRTLQPNGVLIMSSVMNFPIHGYPNDYWRFTPEGFRSLLTPFDNKFVGFTGPAEFPHTILAVAFKGKQPDMDKFLIEYNAWENRCNSVIVKITAMHASN